MPADRTYHTLMDCIRPLALRLLPAVLGVWLGVMVMSGITAAVAFPTLRSLEPHLHAFEKHPGDHWPIAAGHVARRVFDIGAVIQWACGVLAVLCTGVLMRGAQRLRGVAICVILSLAALAWWRLMLDARMSRNLETYWDLARRGQQDAAEAARLAFDADHPLATRTLVVLSLLLLTGIIEAARIRPDMNVPPENLRQ
jgi:hypothetical protein